MAVHKSCSARCSMSVASCIPRQNRRPRRHVFVVRDQEFSQHAPAVGHYTGRFWVSFARHDVEAVLPLQQGAVHRGDWYRFVLDGFERSSRGITVLVPRIAGFVRSGSPHALFSFYLRNRAHREAVEGTSEYVPTDNLRQRVTAIPSLRGYSFTGGFGIHRLRGELSAAAIVQAERRASQCSTTSGCGVRRSSSCARARGERCSARSRSRNFR